MATVLLGWAGIILFLAAPLIGAALLLAGAAGGVGLLVRGLTTGVIAPMLAGLALLALTGGAGLIGYRLLRGEPPVLPKVEWLEPDPLRGRPAPRLYLGGGWTAFATGSGLISQGRVDRVVRTAEGRWREDDRVKRATMFEELRLTPDCARRRASGERIDWFRCTIWEPLTLASGAPDDAYLTFETRDHLADGGVEDQAWLGRGSERRLVARYRVHPPAPRHPLTDWWLHRADRDAVSAAARRCHRAIVERLTVARSSAEGIPR